MPTRAQIVETARGFIGTPWVHQARAKGAGVDCLGLLVGVARELGMPVEDRADYPYEPIPSELLAGLALNLDAIDLDDARAGDVLCFWIGDEARPQHLAILTERGILHAWREGRRCVLEHGLTEGWKAKRHSAWRFRGLED